MINWNNQLEKYFKLPSLHPFQTKVVTSLEKKEDVLVLAPTGGGKSICFQ